MLTSKMEMRLMQRDTDKICKQSKLPMSYLDESNWQPGYGGSTTGWTDYEEYYCSPNEVTSLNIKKYPYGNINEGDIVLLIPKDTQLPSIKEFKVKYNNQIYSTKDGLLESERLGNTFLHYIMVVSVS